MPPGIVGLWILSLGQRSRLLADAARELTNRLNAAGLVLECLDVEERAAGTPVTLDLILRGLSEPLAEMEVLRARIERHRPGVVVVWCDGGGLIFAHRLLKAVRAWTLPSTQTALVGRGVSRHLDEWFRTPGDLRAVMAQIGHYVYGDPVTALEALVRDSLRLDPMPWLIPGVLCADSEHVQLHEGRR